VAKKLYNCHVLGICSGANLSFVEDLGADATIDYTQGPILPALLAQLPVHKYDLIIDCVGGTDLIPHLHQLLHPYASYVTIVGDKTSRQALGGPVTYLTHPTQIIRHLKGMIWGPRYGCISLAMKNGLLERVVGLLERGEARIEVQEIVKGVFGEEEGWKKAVALSEGGRVRGKVVVEIVEG
jgi:NADPH:quinone reductase-like Zn-dependent oxidoreductase